LHKNNQLRQGKIALGRVDTIEKNYHKKIAAMIDWIVE